MRNFEGTHKNEALAKAVDIINDLMKEVDPNITSVFDSFNKTKCYALCLADILQVFEPVVNIISIVEQLTSFNYKRFMSTYSSNTTFHDLEIIHKNSDVIIAQERINILPYNVLEKTDKLHEFKNDLNIMLKKYDMSYIQTEESLKKIIFCLFCGYSFNTFIGKEEIPYTHIGKLNSYITDYEMTPCFGMVRDLQPDKTEFKLIFKNVIPPEYVIFMKKVYGILK